MSYGSDSSLGVGSEDDKEAICPLGDTLAVKDGAEGNRITNPTRESV